ncbi:MAG: enoyl-CoA hydratase/isomerase family protein [Acidimicrobiia bacterium]|nr:enoyl-CoA hydratase/isomerase family protein [Acidimicrobiia bacterium]
MAYENLLFERRDAVAVITLDRPHKLNALDAGLRADLFAALDEVRDDDGVRALVITGAGRGFCAGVDLTSAGVVQEGPTPQNVQLDRLGWVGRQALTIHGLDKPVIAAVNGPAAGAGMSLAMACDMRVGGAGTRFRTSFLERSLSPDSGLSYFLPRVIGYSRAMDLILTSRDVDADEAYRLGLIDRLFADGDLVTHAVELAQHMASMPPLAMRTAKRVVQHNAEVDLHDALVTEMGGLDVSRSARNDLAEAFASFREKRPPRFTGT